MSKSGEKGRASDTPVMRQFFAAKNAHPDALIFFRMGDFYELFFEDAVVAARALDLTLTARNKGAEEEVPMAGVPHHAASAYVQRLLEQGFKVAICEQMADPSTVKGIVPREVVRVVTPGLVYDDAGLSARENHHLVAVESDGAAFGVAALDASTGELSACEAGDAMSAIAELARLDPAEVLLGPMAEAIAIEVRAACPKAAVREDRETPIDLREAEQILKTTLTDPNSDAGPLAKRAAARCVAMARACEPGKPLSIAKLAAYELGDTLLLDEATQRHLELVRTMDGETRGSLLVQIDETKTAPGARLLRRRLLAPKTHIPEIRRRLDAVELFVTQPGLRRDVRERLAEVGDVERLATKLVMDRAGPRDVAALRRSLAQLPAITSLLEGCPDKSARESLGIPSGEPWIDLADDLHALLARAISDDPPVRASEGGAIRTGFDPELDEARLLTRDGQQMIVGLEAKMRESAQIPSLKLRYTRVFGWYVEVTRAHVDKAPREWRRKQTIANGERFTCDELDALADKLAHAEDRGSAREAILYAQLVRDSSKYVARLRAIARRLAEWDVACGLAEVAHRADYARPEVDDSLELVIEDGRHPVVEKLAAAGRFVPNDVALDASPDATSDTQAARLWLVTGPNMAGKSTLMRQVALTVILAQMGSFVPARRARVGLVDRVLTRVGASDNLAKGESTFMVEMKETANVLRRATSRSLVVLDEIGRGTSTYDGLAIAWAVAEHLHDVAHCRALFATHYHELTELAATRRGCENWSVSAREHAGDVVFLHKLQRGAASRSYGVACARLAGVPEAVLARAKAILDGLEKGSALPGGAHASMRGRTASGRTQLDLFGTGASDPATEHPTLALLRAIDTDRLTPLEALQLVASLKASLDPEQDREALVVSASPSRLPLPVGYAFVAIAAASWGTWPLILRAAEKLGPIPASVESTIAMAVIAIISAPFCLRDRVRVRATKWQWLGVAWLGIADALNVGLFFAAYQKTTVAVAVLTHYLTPIFVAMAAPIALGEALRRRTVVAVGLASAGLALLLRPWDAGGGPHLWEGAMLGAGSAVFYASNVIMTKRIAPAFSASEMMFFHSLVSLPLLAMQVPHGLWAATDVRAMGVIALGAIGPGALSGLFFVWGLRRVQASHASTLTLLEPLVAVVLAALVYGETLGAVGFVGGVLILAGAAIVVSARARVASSERVT